MVLGGHGWYSRGKGHPALPTSSSTNVWPRFCIAIAAGMNDGIIYTARRKCHFLDSFVHHNAPQQLRMYATPKLASHAHGEHM